MELLGNCPICGSEKINLFLESKDYFLTNEKFKIDACQDCGFRFTNPRPAAAELGRYYQSTNYISHSDTKKGLMAFVYQLVRKLTIKSKIRLIQKYRTSGALLDIGCATGQFINQIRKSNWSVTGIEPDEKTRNYAISEFGLDVYPENYLNQISQATFDVITMWHVLEHVSDLNNRMEQLKLLLKPDGIIILAVPNCNSYDAKKYHKFWAGYDLPRHLYHFTKSDFSNLAKKYGFTIVNILPMKFDSFYVSLLSEKYKNGSMRWIPALWNGFGSNLFAGPENGYSSQIYILKMEQLN